MNERLYRESGVVTSKAILICALLLLCLGLGGTMFWRNHNTAAEFVSPEPAKLAVAVAKAFAATNGCEGPRLDDASLSDGRWIVALSNRKKFSVVVQVSPEGEVLWYTGVR